MHQIILFAIGHHLSYCLQNFVPPKVIISKILFDPLKHIQILKMSLQLRSRDTHQYCLYRLVEKNLMILKNKQTQLPPLQHLAI